jgi:hypothetical protein
MPSFRVIYGGAKCRRRRHYPRRSVTLTDGEASNAAKTDAVSFAGLLSKIRSLAGHTARAQPQTSFLCLACPCAASIPVTYFNISEQLATGLEVRRLC